MYAVHPQPSPFDPILLNCSNNCNSVLNGEYFKIKFVSIWCCEKEHNDVKNDKIVHGTEKVKPAPNEDELPRVQTLALVGPETLMRSRRLSDALIEFEPLRGEENSRQLPFSFGPDLTLQIWSRKNDPYFIQFTLGSRQRFVGGWIPGRHWNYNLLQRDKTNKEYIKCERKLW